MEAGVVTGSWVSACLPGGRWAGEGGAVFQSQTHRPTSSSCGSSCGRRQTFCGEGGSCICGPGEEAAWRPWWCPVDEASRPRFYTLAFVS